VVAPGRTPSRYVRHGHSTAVDPNEYELGVGILFGGGVIDYTKAHVRDVTGTGGQWDVRLIFGPREVLALETAYVGSARDISGVGLMSGALLVSNGAEGTLRLNIPFIEGLTIVEPFGFVGLGWSRYHVSRSQIADFTSNFAHDDDVLDVPYGAGISIGYGGFLCDARFTYRATYYNDLLRAAGSAQSRLDSWSFGGHIGFEF